MRLDKQNQAENLEYSIEAEGEQSWGSGSVKATAGVKGGSNSAREEFSKNVTNALHKHASKSSSKRDVQVNSSFEVKEQEGEETSIEREIQNLNVSRTLNFVFRQMNQAFISVVHLVDVRVGFFNGFGETREEVALPDLDALLGRVIVDEPRRKIVKTAILDQLQNIMDYRGRPHSLVETVELNDAGGKPVPGSNYVRVKRDYTSTHTDPVTGATITVPGVIMSTDTNTLRTTAPSSRLCSDKARASTTTPRACSRKRSAPRCSRTRSRKRSSGASGRSPRSSRRATRPGPPSMAGCFRRHRRPTIPPSLNPGNSRDPEPCLGRCFRARRCRTRPPWPREAPSIRPSTRRFSGPRRSQPRSPRRSRRRSLAPCPPVDSKPEILLVHPPSVVLGAGLLGDAEGPIFARDPLIGAATLVITDPLAFPKQVSLYESIGRLRVSPCRRIPRLPLLSVAGLWDRYRIDFEGYTLPEVTESVEFEAPHVVTDIEIQALVRLRQDVQGAEVHAAGPTGTAPKSSCSAPLGENREGHREEAQAAPEVSARADAGRGHHRRDCQRQALFRGRDPVQLADPNDDNPAPPRPKKDVLRRTWAIRVVCTEGDFSKVDFNVGAKLQHIEVDVNLSESRFPR